MLLSYFSPIISYRFSSKYARVRIAYVGTIRFQSLQGLDIVNAIELEGVIIKDYFYTLYNKFFGKFKPRLNKT